MKISTRLMTRTARVCALGLALAFSGSALAWEKGKLLIWVGDDRAAKGMRKLAAAYTQKTGIKVVVEVPENPTGTFESSMGGGGGPDIFMWPHDRIGDWAGKGWLSSVSVSQNLKNSIVQVAWDGVTSKGKVWAYPVAVEALSLVYNKALVPVAPKSFEEIPALHASLKAKGVSAIGWEVNNPYMSWPLLAANGGYVFRRDLLGNYEPKNTGVNNQGAIFGAELLQKMVKGGVLNPSQSTGDVEAAMKSGKLAMMLTGPWAWEGLSKAGVKYGIAPIPSVGGQPAAPFVGVLGAMIPAGSPNRAAAVQLIEQHLLPAEGLLAFNKDRPLGIPASKDIFWDFYSDPQIRQAMESVFAGKPMPNNPEMQYFWSNLGGALQEITINGRKPKEALDVAAKNIASGS
ncbi:maltose/maltodextrin ABC transporter substrate-binding protein MalE [Niveibacterium sp. 24ML]|uniref:maltose/maltodextrin ABC transporter substrate-binding protein MalE n=1 Tax=Niveibacterium sp. 24ML TaxID=2985512 RepID=UPI00226EE59F|nr:maltose/maltodextrin ABC transporter substrate-binding protein MalE [Niveibacterium sp. 24ML]MCX9158379.1 maltose/maltodextrin ABC transporter substrate-binding protein MalE [Niveibacterium sp. 24ML]